MPLVKLTIRSEPLQVDDRELASLKAQGLVAEVLDAPKAEAAAEPKPVPAPAKPIPVPLVPELPEPPMPGLAVPGPKETPPIPEPGDLSGSDTKE